jgi:hypothetical protein
MRWAEHAALLEKQKYKALATKTGRKETTWKITRRWENNNKVDFKETRWEPCRLGFISLRAGTKGGLS